MDETGEKAVRDYLSIRDLSAKCGLSFSTIYRLKEQGKIPFFQPAGKRGRLLFPPDAIERTAAAAAAHSSPPPSASNAGGRLSGPRPAWMQSTNHGIKDSNDAP